MQEWYTYPIRLLYTARNDTYDDTQIASVNASILPETQGTVHSCNCTPIINKLICFSRT